MGAKRLTGGGGRNVLNWDKSSRRRNVLKVGARRPGGRNVYGAKCPGASATQYPCVNNLLQHEPKYDEKWYITVSHTSDVANYVLKLARVKTVPGELIFSHLDWVYAIGFNEYILSILGTELITLPSQTVVDLLSANIDTFMLPYPCRLVGGGT